MTSEVLTVRVASETDPQRQYVLHANGDAITCDCRGYTSHGHCKHQDALRRVLDEEDHTMTTETSAAGQAGASLAKRDPDMPPTPLTVSPAPTSLLPTRGDLEAMSLIAGQAIRATGMIPASLKTKEQALAVILAGWELGLRPMTALRHVYCVNGKTEIETRAMVGIIRARDPRIQFSWPEYTREAVTCELTRPGQPVTRVRYTAEDAKASGQLDKPGPWQQFRRDMLYAAATKRACRLGAPDLINAIETGMKTVDEAESLMMPVEVRVGDGPPDLAIPPEAYDEGDNEELAPEVGEVKGIDRTALLVQMRGDIARAKAEWDAPTFAKWGEGITAEIPTKNGAPQFGQLDDGALEALAARIRADVGEGPSGEGQGSLV